MNSIKKRLITTLLTIIFVFSFSSYAQANEDDLVRAALLEQIKTLVELIENLKAQLALQNNDVIFGEVYVFQRNLKLGDEGLDVLALQKELNSNPATVIAYSGPGSPGNETTYFGTLTLQAVARFQELHRAEILAPHNLSQGTGYFGESTRAKLNARRSSSNTQSTGGTAAKTTTSDSGSTVKKTSVRSGGGGGSTKSVTTSTSDTNSGGSSVTTGTSETVTSTPAPVLPSTPAPVSKSSLGIYVPPSGPFDVTAPSKRLPLERYQPTGPNGMSVNAAGVRFVGAPYTHATFHGNVKFNPVTDVDINTDTITPSGGFDSRFVTGTSIQYDAYSVYDFTGGTPNTVMGGLTDGERLWTRVVGNDITLHPTRTDAVNNTNKKDITHIGTGESHRLNRGCGTSDSVYIEASDINLATDVITVLDHGFETGAQTNWGQWQGGSGVPQGLNFQPKWFVGAFDKDSFALYRSSSDASADTNRVNITSAHSGWLNRGNQIFPVRIGAFNTHWLGGTIDAGVSQTLDIDDERSSNGNYCNKTALLMDHGKTQTVEGVRIMNAWDGINIRDTSCVLSAPSGCNQVVNNSWLSDIYDDGIESDQYGSLTVSDVLIENAFSCISMVQGIGPAADQSATDSIELTNLLCETVVKPHNVAHRGEENHIAPLKLRGEPDNPQWNCTGCVFSFEYYLHNIYYAGWDNMWDNIGDVTDTYLLYVAGDTLPKNFPDPSKAPYNATGITVLTGAEARDKWDAARADFIARHPSLDVD